MRTVLIADSGSTKAEWSLVSKGKKTTVLTQGLSPYFVTADDIVSEISKKVLPKIKDNLPEAVYFYGTGCSNATNVRLVKSALRSVFKKSAISVDHDLMGAARALCADKPGVVCILGTGSNSCFYNGKKIMKNSPGLGYVLGDEGSGAYLGRKVIQYFLYKTFDADLVDRFNAKYALTASEILDAVYKKPLANRFLASFTHFLAENRGHYMVENIIEDGFNDFFFNHLFKYSESWTRPIHFTGSVAFVFKDVLSDMCQSYELEMGQVLKNPMEGLVKYHRKLL